MEYNLQWIAWVSLISFHALTEVITLSPGSCNFDDVMICGYTIDAADSSFEWKAVKPGDNFQSTPPKTIQSPFLYLNAQLAREGLSTTLTSVVIPQSYGICSISFLYYLYTFYEDYLSLEVRVQGQSALLWKRNSSLIITDWLDSGNIDLANIARKGDFKVIFRATVLKKAYGKAAASLDDVVIQGCQDSKSTSHAATRSTHPVTSAVNISITSMLYKTSPSTKLTRTPITTAKPATHSSSSGSKKTTNYPTTTSYSQSTSSNIPTSSTTMSTSRLSTSNTSPTLSIASSTPTPSAITTTSTILPLLPQS
ncbi:uncharacterized protein LOC106160741 [Lingula anatina]|uniref:Uncharacterized protein LOC106160741 n=1 Tax=Lingula anatina TaxID=7574 RepID=A0A1S3I3M4_LINAN|nr:uncharacterized protein LOC106160741 [Lingula anatina]|eukprot:XP_013392865.1 uncharacterized protein LOC106160741 [Lingula anatina]